VVRYRGRRILIRRHRRRTGDDRLRSSLTACPLIAIERIERLKLIPQALEGVLEPDVVAQKRLTGPRKTGARAMVAALNSGLVLRVANPSARLQRHVQPYLPKSSDPFRAAKLDS
jgi:hypothetical protein